MSLLQLFLFLPGFYEITPFYSFVNIFINNSWRNTQMFEEYDELITVEDMQKLLGIGKNTAYELLKEKKIKCFRIGRIWKIPKRSIEEYILTQAGIQLDKDRSRSF